MWSWPASARSCTTVWYGAFELRSPHPLFDPLHYVDHGDGPWDEHTDPLRHHLAGDGGRDGRRPNPWFDADVLPPALARRRRRRPRPARPLRRVRVARGPGTRPRLRRRPLPPDEPGRGRRRPRAARPLPARRRPPGSLAGGARRRRRARRPRRRHRCPRVPSRRRARTGAPSPRRAHRRPRRVRRARGHRAARRAGLGPDRYVPREHDVVYAPDVPSTALSPGQLVNVALCVAQAAYDFVVVSHGTAARLGRLASHRWRARWSSSADAYARRRAGATLRVGSRGRFVRLLPAPATRHDVALDELGLGPIVRDGGELTVAGRGAIVWRPVPTLVPIGPVVAAPHPARRRLLVLAGRRRRRRVACRRGRWARCRRRHRGDDRHGRPPDGAAAAAAATDGADLVVDARRARAARRRAAHRSSCCATTSAPTACGSTRRRRGSRGTVTRSATCSRRRPWASCRRPPARVNRPERSTVADNRRPQGRGRRRVGRRRRSPWSSARPAPSATLPAVLAALETQTADRDDVEVLVIAESAGEALQRWAGGGNRRLVVHPGAGVAGRLDLGVFLATAPLVLFLADDERAEPDLVVEHLPRPRPVPAVGGRRRRAFGVGRRRRIDVADRGDRRGRRRPARVPRHAPARCTPDLVHLRARQLSTKRSFLARRGVFDPSFDRFPDVELGAPAPRGGPRPALLVARPQLAPRPAGPRRAMRRADGRRARARPPGPRRPVRARRRTRCGGRRGRPWARAAATFDDDLAAARSAPTGDVVERLRRDHELRWASRARGIASAWAGPDSHAGAAAAGRDRPRRRRSRPVGATPAGARHRRGPRRPGELRGRHGGRARRRATHYDVDQRWVVVGRPARRRRPAPALPDRFVAARRPALAPKFEILGDAARHDAAGDLRPRPARRRRRRPPRRVPRPVPRPPALARLHAGPAGPVRRVAGRPPDRPPAARLAGPAHAVRRGRAGAQHRPAGARRHPPVRPPLADGLGLRERLVAPPRRALGHRDHRCHARRSPPAADGCALRQGRRRGRQRRAPRRRGPPPDRRLHARAGGPPARRVRRAERSGGDVAGCVAMEAACASGWSGPVRGRRCSRRRSWPVVRTASWRWSGPVVPTPPPASPPATAPPRPDRSTSCSTPATRWRSPCHRTCRPTSPLRAAAAGRPVLLDKPIGLELAQAERLADAVGVGGRRVAARADEPLPGVDAGVPARRRRHRPSGRGRRSSAAARSPAATSRRRGGWRAAACSTSGRTSSTRSTSPSAPSSTSTRPATPSGSSPSRAPTGPAPRARRRCRRRRPPNRAGWCSSCSDRPASHARHRRRGRRRRGPGHRRGDGDDRPRVRGRRAGSYVARARRAPWAPPAAPARGGRGPARGLSAGRLRTTRRRDGGGGELGGAGVAGEVAGHPVHRVGEREVPAGVGERDRSARAGVAVARRARRTA